MDHLDELGGVNIFVDPMNQRHARLVQFPWREAVYVFGEVGGIIVSRIGAGDDKEGSDYSFGKNLFDGPVQRLKRVTRVRRDSRWFPESGVISLRAINGLIELQRDTLILNDGSQKMQRRFYALTGKDAEMEIRGGC